MAQWNQRPTPLNRKGSVTSAATGIAFKTLLATCLYGEFNAKLLCTFVLSRFNTPENPTLSEFETTFKILHQITLTACGALTTLWLFQDCGDLVAGLTSGRSTKHSQGPAEKDQPAQPQQLAPLPDSLETPTSGTPYQRQRPSPYQRTASPYSNLAPAASPEDMLRMQQQFTESLSQPGRRPDATPLPNPLSGSLPATPGSADWALSPHSATYLSPPTLYQYQQLPGAGALAAELPKYHYSLQWSSGGVAASNTTMLHPSAPRAVDALLRRLMIDRNVLRLWAERLRTWSSERVMQPLLRAMAAASKNAATALQASNTPLRVLMPALVPTSGNWADLELPSDDDLHRAVAALRQLREQARPAQTASVFGGFGAAQQQQQPAQNLAALVAAEKLQEGTTSGCVQAVSKYRQLCKLLRGDFPQKGILGNCPPGYLGSRIAALGDDSACGGFKWKAGGPWQGRSWTAELPTDTHILLYLLGAFFTAPFWRFEETSSMILGAGGPLCVGQLPANNADPVTAIVSGKPKKESMAALKAALLLLSGPSNEPLIMLVLDGQPTVTLCGEWAAFEKVVLFLAFIKLELGRKIGPFTFEYLDLESVLEDVQVDTSVRQRRWLGILS